MATFAPEVPAQTGTPFFWQHPTQQPKADESGKIIGEAVGQGLSEAGSLIRSGTEGITQAYEKGIQNAIYAGVDPLRDDYMKRLHEADQAVQGRNTPDPLGRDAPSDVKKLPSSLDTLDSARANGKLSQTDYDARLTALAKEIRAKYPGFRQYVDEEFKRVTGRDSANQYIHSVIQDIDSYVAKKGAAKDKFEALLFQHAYNYKDGDEVVRKYMADPAGYRVAAGNWLNDRLTHDHLMTTIKNENDAQEGLQKLADQDQVKKFQEGSGQSAATFYNPTRSWFLIATGVKGDERIQGALTAIQTGDKEKLATYSKEELASLAENLNTWGMGKKMERAKELREAYSSSAITDKMIEDKVNAEYNMYLEPFIKALADKDLGLATGISRFMDGDAQDSWKIIEKEDPTLAGQIKMLAGLRKAEPKVYEQLMLRPDMATLTDRAMALVTKHRLGLATPAGQPGSMTSNQVLDDQSRKNQTDGRLQRLTVDFMKLAGDKEINPAFRKAIFENSFAEDSGEILKYFAKESYTGPPFKRYLGQQWVYDQLTDPKMITEGEKFGKENAKSYDNYRKWAESSVNYLLTDWSKYTGSASGDRYAPMGAPSKGDVRRMTPSTMGAVAGEALGEKAPNPDITVTYNDATHEFTFLQNGKTSPRADLVALSRNMNRLGDVIKHDPNNPNGDPTKAIYELLKTHNAEEGSVLFKMEHAMRLTRGE